VAYKRVQRKLTLSNNEDGDGNLFINVLSASNNHPRIMTNERLAESVLHIIIAGNLSFSFAENKEFTDLLKHAYPMCKAPNRKGVRALLKDKAASAIEEIKETLGELDSKVSLALDAWTGRNNMPFLGTISCYGRCFKMICNLTLARNKPHSEILLFD
jgi:hypothetical protein